MKYTDRAIYLIRLTLAVSFILFTFAIQADARGLEVVGLHQPESPTISFRVLVHSGSINDPTGKKGLCALTVNTMAEGGAGDLEYKEILEKLYPMAASIQTHVDKEVVVLTGMTTVDELESFYEIFSMVILSPRFEQSDFERQKDISTNFIRNTLRGNNDELLGKTALELFIFDGHPYRHPVAGTIAGLKNISVDDLKSFHREHFTRENITVGIIGGYPDGFEKRVKKDFESRLPGKKPPEEIELPEVPRDNGMKILLVEKPCRSVAISMGHPLDVSRNDRDFYALMVANSFLGEHRTFNGLLMNNIRGLRGLNYGDYSYIEYFVQDHWSQFARPNIPRRDQFFSIWIRPVAPENAHFTLRLAIHEVTRLINQGLTQRDFARTRNFLLGYTRLWSQTPDRRLGILLDSNWYGMDKDFLGTINQVLPTLTLEEVNAALRKHIHPADLDVVMVCEDAGATKEHLLNNDPSPIVYQDAGSTSYEVRKEDKAVAKLPLSIKNVDIIKVEDIFEK
jgi:zinc protease